MALDEAVGGEIDDLLAVNGGIEAEVEAFERLLEIEARATEPERELFLRPALDLVLPEPLEEVDVGELLLQSLAIAQLQGLEDAREAQLLEFSGPAGG